MPSAQSRVHTELKEARSRGRIEQAPAIWVGFLEEVAFVTIVGWLGCSRVSLQAKRCRYWQLEVGLAHCSGKGEGTWVGSTASNSVAKSEGCVVQVKKVGCRDPVSRADTRTLWIFKQTG